MSPQHVRCEPLTRDHYHPFGEVIAAGTDWPSAPTNQGTARRYDHLCRMENLRPETAVLNVCIFRVAATSEDTIPLAALEKHPYSTQTFAPLTGSGQYLAVVARGGETPKLDSLRAFRITGATAISYRPGVWHHPLIALEPSKGSADFLCHIYEEDPRRFPENQNTVRWGDPHRKMIETFVSIPLSLTDTTA